MIRLVTEAAKRSLATRRRACAERVTGSCRVTPVCDCLVTVTVTVVRCCCVLADRCCTPGADAVHRPLFFLSAVSDSLSAPYGSSNLLLFLLPISQTLLAVVRCKLRRRDVNRPFLEYQHPLQLNSQRRASSKNMHTERTPQAGLPDPGLLMQPATSEHAWSMPGWRDSG